MTLTDYNVALAKVKELEAQLAAARKAVEDALPKIMIGSLQLRLNGEVIEQTVSGEWSKRGLVPRTLTELRAMADAFLPERKLIGYTVADKDGDIGDRYESQQKAEEKVRAWNMGFPTLAPHRVVGLVEVEDA